MAVMKDVAKLAGVSISTVSFVLNGTAKEHKVADKTAQKVLCAARDLGYQLNAPSVISPSQLTIALFFPSVSLSAEVNLFASAMERQIQQTDTPFNLLLCLYERGQLEMRIRNLAPSAYTAAIVVAESESDRNALEKLPNTLPLILFNGTSRNFCSVSCQTEDSIRQAAQIISAKNYHNIVILSGVQPDCSEDDTLNQLMIILHQQGIPISLQQCFSTENSYQGGAIAARRILNLSEKPELVITMNTTLAFGAIPLLARNDFIFTQQSELLSFGRMEDRNHLSNYIPSISFIGIPMSLIAEDCFTLALRLARGELKAAEHVRCQSNLMLNASFTI